jgi:23S rRNA (cytidine2498-2'-O)-methyltransferase
VSAFLWFLHQPACASWMKRELSASRPDLRFAFARPGLTTFKVEADRLDTPVASSFARAHGRSLGRAKDLTEVAALLEKLDAAPRVLHVFERDPDVPADERDAAVVATRPREIERQLREAFSARFVAAVEAKPGDRVLDVICAPSEAPDDGWLVGEHVHDDTRGPLPGGVPHVAIPPAAPSRAWAKIEEAIRWSGLVPRAGDKAIELGSAPGGASFALLERGLEVHGVDPGAMAESVLRYRGPRGNRFVHHEKPAAEVERRDLPARFEWLASDVNLAPMVALKYVERFVALAHGGLRGAFITLKLNDDGVFAALPRLQQRIAKLGARRVRYTQLPSHRSEIVAILSW